MSGETRALPRPGASPRRALAVLAVGIACALAGCLPAVSATPAPPPEVLAKIAFPLEGINRDGLIGTGGSLRALDYEFCIPADETKVQAVLAIDPGVRVMRGSRGRIGCTTAEILCVNNTHRSGWRDALFRLAELPYVRRIQRTDWE